MRVRRPSAVFKSCAPAFTPRPEWVARAARPVVFTCLLAALTACGISYQSPRVRDNDPDLPVDVVSLTFQSVTQANTFSYVPRSLPPEFRATTGAGGGVRGLGALPAPPDVLTERPLTVPLDPPPPMEPEPYRIGIGDVILIASRGQANTIEQLSGLLAAQNQRQGYTVRDDGAIAIPEIGTVSLVGLTLTQAEDQLFQILVENQIDPSFSLEIAEFNSQKIAIGGAVRDAQVVHLGLQPVTLNDAITLAGGITSPDEDFVAIRIYRDETLYQIPFTAFLEQASLRDITLANGDAIYVDTTYDLDRALDFYRQQIDVIQLRASARNNALQALATEIGIKRQALAERRQNFQARIELDAIERDYVYVTGEVRGQTRIELPFERKATLADVLYDAGGFNTATGNPAEIYVLRADVPSAPSGMVTAYHLNAANAAKLVVATQMNMRPNDVVFIEEQPIAKWGRSLQQFLPFALNQAAN